MDHDDLVTCERCGLGLAAPVEWSACGSDLWLVVLYCDGCRHTRVVLADGRRLAVEFERQRVLSDAEAFIRALRMGLIMADDFAEDG